MKEQINRTRHAEELFAAAGFSKQKIRGQIWFVSLKFSIGFDLDKKEVLIKESNTPRMETHSSIDIPTLKAINMLTSNAMVYELGWYKNEPSK